MQNTVRDSETQGGRARLLQAGLELFGQKGFAGTSITELCDHAGVSRGLVRAYFGSKQALADEVDLFILKRLEQLVEEELKLFRAEGLVGSLRKRSFPTLGDDLSTYIRRCLLEPTPRNVGFFVRLFKQQREIVAQFEESGASKQNVDTEWLTLLKIFFDFGPLMFAPQIEAVLGRDYSGEASRARMFDVYLALYGHFWDMERAFEHSAKTRPKR
jgi:AcrR family transcriptional regulator